MKLRYHLIVALTILMGTVGCAIHTGSQQAEQIPALQEQPQSNATIPIDVLPPELTHLRGSAPTHYRGAPLNYQVVDNRITITGYIPEPKRSTNRHPCGNDATLRQQFYR